MLLQEIDKQTLIGIFSKLTMPVEVWAYGSRVNSTAHDGSDLDLVIRDIYLTRLPHQVIKQLRQNIHDTTIPILIQLYDSTLPQSFHQNILQQYEVLFDNRKQFVLDEKI